MAGVERPADGKKDDPCGDEDEALSTKESTATSTSIAPLTEDNLAKVDGGTKKVLSTIYARVITISSTDHSLDSGYPCRVKRYSKSAPGCQHLQSKKWLER